MSRVFLAYGVSVGIRSNAGELLDQMASRLPPDSRETPGEAPGVWYTLVGAPVAGGPRVRYSLYEDAALLGEGWRLTRLLDELDSAVRLHVGVHAPDRLFVHAGVVAWRDRVLLLPAASRAGKTTLVQALVEAGATYYSDEYAVLDAAGRVHPYARPISRRQGAHRRVSLDVEADLGGVRARQPLPVALVVHTRFKPGAAWNPIELPPGESALATFAHTLAARQRTAFAFSVISRTVLAAHSLAGDRGDACDAARAVLRQLQALPPTSEPGLPTP